MKLGLNEKNHIVFIFDSFPDGIDPSILEEIEELKERGVPIEIVCLNSRNGNHAGSDSPQLNGCIARPDWRSFLLSMQKLTFLCFEKPVELISAVMVLIRENYSRPFFLARILGMLPRLAWISWKVRNIPHSIVQSHPTEDCAIAAWFTSRLANTPYLLGVNGHYDLRKNGSLKSVVVEAKGMLTRTKNSKTSILNQFNGDLRAPIWLLYQGLRIENYSPDESVRGDGFTILALCNDKSAKGFDEFVMACTRLMEQGVSFKCILIGNGLTYQRTESMVYDKSLEHMFDCLGDLPEEEILKCMNRAHVLVIPGFSQTNGEYVPAWAVKAMAMHLPIVATRTSQIQEIVKDFVSGILVTPGDPISLASALHTLYYHPEIRRQLGNRARQLVDSRFNLLKNINIIEEIYKTIGD